MKKILTILALIAGYFCSAQSTGYFRYDSSRFEKVGGNNELIILNGTRAVTNGVLTNIGNGRTAFVTPSAGTLTGANNGTSVLGGIVQLGEATTGGAASTPFTSDRWIQAGAGTVYKLTMQRDISSFGPPYTSYPYTYTEFTRPSIVSLKSVDGGALNFTVFDSSAAVGSSFPGVYFYAGYNQTLQGGAPILHWSTTDKHIDLVDLRGSTTYAAIQADGTSIADFRRSTGHIHLALYAGSRVGVGYSTNQMGQRLSVAGSFSATDTALLAGKTKIFTSVGTTSDSVLVKDISTGFTKAVLQSSIVGATPTWPQTLAVSGGSTLTADVQVDQSGRLFNMYGDVGQKRTWFYLGKDSTMDFSLYNTSGVSISGVVIAGVDSSVVITSPNGNIKFNTLQSSIDTATYKPFAISTAGLVRRMNSWAQVAGGGSSLTAGYGILLPSTAIIADTTILVNKAGAQVISGNKIFTNDINFGGVAAGNVKLSYSGTQLRVMLGDGSTYANLAATGIVSGSTTFTLATTNATTINIGDANAAIISLGAGTSGAELQWQEPSASGSNYFGLKAQAMAANQTYLWPAAVGAAGSVLYDAAGNGTLSFLATSSLTGLPYIALTGVSTLTGNVIVAGGSNIFDIRTTDEVLLGDNQAAGNGNYFHIRGSVGYFIADNTAHDVKFGINTSTPSVPLHVYLNSDNGDVAILENANSDGRASFILRHVADDVGFRLTSGGLQINSLLTTSLPITFSGNHYTFDASDGGEVTMAAYGAGTATFDGSGNITSVSDKRAKHNIKPFRYGLDAILKLNPSTFIYNQDKSNTVMSGFIAQDVQRSIPIAVHEGKIDPKTGERGMMSLETNAILGASVNAIQELYKIIQDQQRQIDQLKSKQ